MTTTVRVYKSTDAGAPVLTGQAGSYIALLSACLVNGYGSQAGAGWTSPFPTAANVAVYKMAAGTIGGTAQMYLRVDDTGTNNASANGFETMTSLSSGTGQFPTAVQQPVGIYFYKSVTTDATARPWILFATERTFYVMGFAQQTVFGQSNTSDGGFGFGAFYSYKAGDAYNCFIKGATSTTAGNGLLGSLSGYGTGQIFTNIVGFYIARAYTQLGGSYNAAMSHLGTSGYGTPVSGYNLGGAFPDPVTGGMKMTRYLVTEADYGYITRMERGFLPGMWMLIHNLPGNHFDVYNGSGDLASRTFMNVNLYYTSTAGRGAFEITGSWDT